MSFYQHRWVCPACGANNMPQSAACFRCGAQQLAQPAPAVPPHQQQTTTLLNPTAPVRRRPRWRTAVLGGALVAILVLAATNPDRGAFADWQANLISEQMRSNPPPGTDPNSPFSRLGEVFARSLAHQGIHRQNFIVGSLFWRLDPDRRPVWRTLGVAGRFIPLDPPPPLPKGAAPAAPAETVSPAPGRAASAAPAAGVELPVPPEAAPAVRLIWRYNRDGMLRGQILNLTGVPLSNLFVEAFRGRAQERGGFYVGQTLEPVRPAEVVYSESGTLRTSSVIPPGKMGGFTLQGISLHSIRELRVVRRYGPRAPSESIPFETVIDPWPY